MFEDNDDGIVVYRIPTNGELVVLRVGVFRSCTRWEESGNANVVRMECVGIECVS